MKLVGEVITLRDRVVTRGRRISGLSPPSASISAQNCPDSRVLTDALWSLYDQSKEELGRKDGEEEEDSSFRARRGQFKWLCQVPRRFKGNAACLRALVSWRRAERMGIKWAGRFNFRHSGGSGKSRGRRSRTRKRIARATDNQTPLSFFKPCSWLRDSWSTTKKIFNHSLYN